MSFFAYDLVDLTKKLLTLHHGDSIDALNYEYTAAPLIIIGLLETVYLFVAHPIECWVPAEFTSAWEAYVESYCFFGSAQYTSPKDECKKMYDDDACDHVFTQDPARHLAYYQWVPVLTICQGLLFVVPCLCWQSWIGGSGINVKSILNSAATIKKKFDKNTRHAQVHKTAEHLIEALEMQRELKTSSWGFQQVGKRRGIYLVTLYLFTKLLYVCNVLLQFVILNAFLGPQYTFWGFGILQDLINGREWTESGHFPRVTLCDFNVRVLSNIHRWTVQCVLMINMFNEKVFIFFWFWFVAVGVLSVLSLVYWLFATTMAGNRRGFVAKYLRCQNAIEEPPSAREQGLIEGFVRDFLRPDGVFLLRLVQTNGGDLLVGEIISALFRKYAEKQQNGKQDSRAVTESPEST